MQQYTSPYCFVGNNPSNHFDVRGLEEDDPGGRASSRYMGGGGSGNYGECEDCFGSPPESAAGDSEAETLQMLYASMKSGGSYRGNIIGGAQSVQTGGGAGEEDNYSTRSYNYYMNLNEEVDFMEPTNGPSAYYYPSLAEMSEEFDEHLSNYSKGLAFAISYEEGPAPFSKGARIVNSFAGGFSDGPPSDELSVSGGAGLGGLVAEGVERGIKTRALYTTAAASIQYAGRASNVARSIGIGLGYVGIAATLVESLYDGKLSYGDGYKMAIGVASVALPGFGLTYGLVDFGTQLATGTSLTDRMANGIDASMP